jgi:adenylate cyclase
MPLGIRYFNANLSLNVKRCLMTRQTNEIAILFADIAKSTLLYEVLGNLTAQQLIGTSLSKLGTIAQRFGGTVIKTIGDEIMCTFPSAETAVEAGVMMHQAMNEFTLPDHPDFSSPNIYIGFQFGPVVVEGGDVFGDAVNVAAHMAAVAKQRQIITTEDTVRLLPEEFRNTARFVDKTNIKGKSGETKIFEIVWEHQDVTLMLDDGFATQVLRSVLEVRHGEEAITVDECRPTATLGRQLHNDIVVQDSRVSRSHARLEYRRGRFVLIDQSTNGTFVVMQGKKKVQVKNEEVALIGSGLIGLGREVDDSSVHAVHYSIRI